MSKRCLSLIIWLLVIAGCARGAAAPVVTGDAAGAPAGCSPQVITARLVDFATALNHGDTDVVKQFFASDAPFEWYSMSVLKADQQQSNVVAYNPADLTTYFAQRIVQHEHLTLRMVQFNGWESARGLVHFGPIELTRRADDLPAGELAVAGKGAYHCASHALIVLSLVTTLP